MTAGEQSGIILVSDGDTTWLLEGDTYLSALLSDEEYYPTPVRLIVFETGYDLHLSKPEELNLSSLWAVHPNIIDRLRRQNNLIEEKG